VAVAAPRTLDTLVVLLVEPPHLLEEGVAQEARVGAERSFLYHSIVLRSPSSKPVSARKPKSRSARAVSSDRRGWPSGWSGFHTLRPENPVRRAMSCTRSRIVISNPAPRFTASAPL